jgi:hypothetical protein
MVRASKRGELKGKAVKISRVQMFGASTPLNPTGAVRNPVEVECQDTLAGVVSELSLSEIFLYFDQ